LEVIVGHSDEVIAPKPSGPEDPVHRPEVSSDPQPATEMPDAAGTERRRLVAMAGYSDDEDAARHGLDDPLAIVRSTAIGALDRLGALTTDDLVHALSDADATVRRRGCELAATRVDVDLTARLVDSDASVVEMAAWALGEQGSSSAVPALAALANERTGHRDPLCREAAVASLGAIGDPGGLFAVLAALEDKPAIRRRAAVALAAFEGPDVEAALHRCLDDRDWQVRQVAEDLLAVERLDVAAVDRDGPASGLGRGEDGSEAVE
jgi:HEAT repeat protein